MSEASTKRSGLPIRMKMRAGAHYVDEITTRDGESIGRIVSLEDVETDPEQPRSQMGDLSELVDSVRRKGVLEPILVRPNPDYEPGRPRYRIISGERRFRAAQEGALDEVPIIEMEVDEDEALEIALIENLQRKDLTPFEEAEGYRALGERFDYTHEQIAGSMGKSRTVITESLSLLSIPQVIRELADDLGVYSKSLLLEVGKLGTEAEMRQALQQASENRLSRDDLRQRTRTKSKKGTAKSGPKPYVFKFRAPDKSYNLSLNFKRDTVDPQDLIDALEQTLFELRRVQRRKTRHEP